MKVNRWLQTNLFFILTVFCNYNKSMGKRKSTRFLKLSFVLFRSPDEQSAGGGGAQRSALLRRTFSGKHVLLPNMAATSQPAPGSCPTLEVGLLLLRGWILNLTYYCSRQHRYIEGISLFLSPYQIRIPWTTLSNANLSCMMHYSLSNWDGYIIRIFKKQKSIPSQNNENNIYLLCVLLICKIQT